MLAEAAEPAHDGPASLDAQSGAAKSIDKVNMMVNMMKGQSLQDPYLNTLRKERVPVSIYLVNGIKLQGKVESFDQFVVLLRNSVSQMVYKHAISTIVPAHNVQMPSNDPRSASGDGSRSDSNSGPRSGSRNGPRSGPRHGSRSASGDESRSGSRNGPRSGPRHGSRSASGDESRSGSRNWPRAAPDDDSRSAPRNGPRAAPDDDSRSAPRNGPRTAPDDDSHSEPGED